MDEKVSVSPEQTNCDWNSIDWISCYSFVHILRQRIYRATKEGNLKLVRSLQRLMLRSYENCCLAVRRVTQENRGKDTTGVDKVLVQTPEERGRLVDELGQYELWKPLPARRVYIPKANGKLRPLGIPVIVDRAIQAIVKNALEPFWEAKFEDSSFGFRPGRGCHDAIERLYKFCRSRSKRKWVLDADIKGAFDNIDHAKLLEVIGNFPARGLIEEWLKAGYMEEGVFHDTEAGTPQGGVISPLLANIAFHGMEEALGVRYVRKRNGDNSEISDKSVVLIRYADDFVVLCHSREQAEEAKAKLVGWFAERGLTFSEEKTRITNLEDGFDFLGFNVRQYKVTTAKNGIKTLIKPNKSSVKKMRRKLKELFRQHRGCEVGVLIQKVNPVIRGWANYFRTGVSKRIFSQMDHYLFQLQQKWTRWKHHMKSWKWRKERYWFTRNGDRWVFGNEDLMMNKFAWFPIERHVLVQRGACWDDPNLTTYWMERSKKITLLMLTSFQRVLAKQQNYVCPICRESLGNDEELHQHHVVRRRDGGSDKPENQQLVHLYCHLAVHGRKRSEQMPVA
jgi:RNA-directed DNA polymerase